MKHSPFTSTEMDDVIKSLAAGHLHNEFKVNEKLLEVSAKIEEAIVQVEAIFDYVHHTNQIPLMEIKETIIPTIQQAVEIPQFFYLFHELRKADDYTYRHNIGVGVIATLIGKWLDLSPLYLEKITIAATLHDIGKTKIPQHILNKPGKLTSEEYEKVKKHTLYGYELLKNTDGIPQEISLVALQHHERENGIGYPFGLKGEQISLISKIVAVADVFHAMSSNRVYHEALPFYSVIKQMNDDVFGKFDPKVLIPFISNIMQSLVGNEVMLNDGRCGVILMLNPFNVLKPIVKVNRTIIDLSQNKQIEIQRILA
jgi:HD-GYP domain-containing protein (c-di-GMP phosphodiesterase class II)